MFSASRTIPDLSMSPKENGIVQGRSYSLGLVILDSISSSTVQSNHVYLIILPWPSHVCSSIYGLLSLLCYIWLGRQYEHSLVKLEYYQTQRGLIIDVNLTRLTTNFKKTMINCKRKMQKVWHLQLSVLLDPLPHFNSSHPPPCYLILLSPTRVPTVLPVKMPKK